MRKIICLLSVVLFCACSSDPVKENLEEYNQLYKEAIEKLNDVDGYEEVKVVKEWVDNQERILNEKLQSYMRENPDREAAALQTIEDVENGKKYAELYEEARRNEAKYKDLRKKLRKKFDD